MAGIAYMPAFNNVSGILRGNFQHCVVCSFFQMNRPACLQSVKPQRYTLANTDLCLHCLD